MKPSSVQKELERIMLKHKCSISEAWEIYDDVEMKPNNFDPHKPIMTKQKYLTEVKDKLQKQIWDIELNNDFNNNQIETLEQDINDGQGLIFVPGKEERDGTKLIGQLKQELTQRHRKRETFETQKQVLQEQIDFINTLK